MKIARVLSCLIAFAVLACQDDAQRAAEHAKKGDELLKAEKWDEAVIEFKNATKLSPNDGASHFGLARAYLGRKEPKNAYWELEETVRLDPNNVQARIDHGQFLLFGKTDELERAVASGDAIIAAEPKRWEGYLLKGRALAALGRHEEAGEVFGTGVKVAPDQPAIVLVWANHLRQAGKLEEAEAAYKRLAELAPGFWTSAALAGFYASTTGRDAEAEAAYRKALESAKPDEVVPATKVFADFLGSRERSAEAEEVLKKAIASKPDSVDLIYVLAGFYAQQGRESDADQMIEQATTAQPDKPEPWLVLSAHRGKAGDLDGALKAAEQAVKAAPDNDLAKLRRAEVLVDIGARNNDSAVLAQAEAAVNAILSQNEEHPEANFVKGKLEIARRNFPAALAALRRTIDRRPDMAQAYFLSGSAKFLTGDRAGARGDAQEALARQPGFLEALGLLARTHAALGDHALAVEAGKRALERGAGPDMQILIAQSLVQLGQRQEALQQLAQIPEAARGVDTEYATGRVHLIEALQLASAARNPRGEVVKPEMEARADAEFATARVHLTRAAELAPNHAEVLESLVTIDLRQNQPEASLARVKAASQAAPKDAALARLQGDVEFSLQRFDAAEQSYERAIKIDPNELESYAKLAGLYNRQGRGNQVISTYEAAVQRNPKSGELHLVLGILKEAQGGRGIDDAIVHYKKAIELNPQLAAAKNNLAFWLAERGQDLDYALDLAQEAKAELAKNPRTNPSSADTLGWVFYKNLPEAAVNYLREAVGGFDPSFPQDRQTRPLVRHHLALALAALGDKSEAASEWKLALAEYGELPKAQGEAEPGWVKEARAGLAKTGA